MKPGRRRGGGGLADPQNPSRENQQYVQTEWTSPTLHVPRRFPSRVSHRARCAATVAVPICLLTHPDPTMLLHNTCAMWVRITFPLVATDRRHAEQPGSKVWNSTGRGFVFPSPRTQNIFRRCVVPCRGSKWGHNIHTHISISHYFHIMFRHGLSTQQPRSISSVYILKCGMETEIKLNKTLGTEAGLV